MDPTSFAAAFLLSREPVTQPKLTVSPNAVIAAPAEVAAEPAPSAPEPSLIIRPPEMLVDPVVAHETIQDTQKTTIAIKAKPELTSSLNHVRQSEYPAPRSSTPRPLAPIVWRLTDRFGTMWTHPNKSYLERFVEGRNATVLVPCYSYQYVTGSSCSGGQCSR